eukprot:RCo027215
MQSVAGSSGSGDVVERAKSLANRLFLFHEVLQRPDPTTAHLQTALSAAQDRVDALLAACKAWKGVAAGGLGRPPPSFAPLVARPRSPDPHSKQHPTKPGPLLAEVAGAAEVNELANVVKLQSDAM